MLENGNYPIYLKKRISGDEGHLSNQQALELFRNHRHKDLSHLILSHLSENNNSTEVAEALFRPHAGNTFIIAASRFAESALFSIKARESFTGRKMQLTQERPGQLTLF